MTAGGSHLAVVTRVCRWGPPVEPPGSVGGSDDSLLRDLILLGMKPATTEAQVRLATLPPANHLFQS